jgi:beta-glucosidase-like glycosyl hydrolase
MLPEQARDQEELVKRLEAMLLKEKEERQARDDAREAQFKAEAAAAEAKAERAAADAKIAEEAASKAEMKLKEKEELLEKTKKEAEDAAAKAAEASKEVEEIKKLILPLPPPEEKKAPVRFHDAIGRKFNFPFHLCTKWPSMEELIRQAFEHVEEIGPHVHAGHYDLIGPDSGIIVPSAWETTIEPDMKITMHMWPIPEPKEEPIPPPPDVDDYILNLDDLLGPEKEVKGKGETGNLF